MINNEEISSEKVLSLALDLGKNMIKCSAEINRVEDTVIRICYAYGMKQTQVFSIISMINATVTEKSGKTHTQMRRIYSYSTNFGRLEKLNALSRRICNETPDIDKAREELDEICSDKKKYSIMACIGHIIAASSFTMFFGGSLLDAVAAAPIAFIVWLFNTYIKARGMSRLFFTALNSAISGALALFFVRFGFGTNASAIMMGDIMLIIPGLMLINSVREMLCGDVMSGLLRLLESIIISLAIACGFAVPLLLAGQIK